MTQPGVSNGSSGAPGVSKACSAAASAPAGSSGPVGCPASQAPAAIVGTKSSPPRSRRRKRPIERAEASEVLFIFFTNPPAYWRARHGSSASRDIARRRHCTMHTLRDAPARRVVGDAPRRARRTYRGKRASRRLGATISARPTRLLGDRRHLLGRQRDPGRLPVLLQVLGRAWRRRGHRRPHWPARRALRRPTSERSGTPRRSTARRIRPRAPSSACSWAGGPEPALGWLHQPPAAAAVGPRTPSLIEAGEPPVTQVAGRATRPLSPIVMSHRACPADPARRARGSPRSQRARTSRRGAARRGPRATPFPPKLQADRAEASCGFSANRQER